MLPLDQTPTRIDLHELEQAIILHLPSPAFPEDRRRRTLNPTAWFPLARILCTTAIGLKSYSREYLSQLSLSLTLSLTPPKCNGRSARLNTTSDEQISFMYFGTNDIEPGIRSEK